MKTDVAVPADLSGLSRQELIDLRNRLISAGTRAGGIDERLKLVAIALRKPRPERKQEGRRAKRKGGSGFGSLGSGAKMSKLKGKKDG